MARLVTPELDSIELNPDKLNFIFNDRGTLQVWAEDDSRRKPQCALWRTRRGSWVVLDYTGHNILVDGLRVADSKIVRDDEHIQIGDMLIRFQEIRRFIIEAGADWLASDLYGDESECPRCLRSFKDCVGEEVVICPMCNTMQHLECWQERVPPGCNNCSYEKNLSGT